jgi:hypothetical protein
MTNVSKLFFVLSLLILNTSALQAGPFNRGFEDMDDLAVFARELFKGAHGIDFEQPQPTAPAPPEYSGVSGQKYSSLYPPLPAHVDPVTIPGVAISKIGSIWSDLFSFVEKCREFTGVLYEKGEWFYNFPELEETRGSFRKEAERAETALNSMQTSMAGVIAARNTFHVSSDSLAEALTPPTMGRPHAKHQRNVSGDFRDQCLKTSQKVEASSEEMLGVLNQEIGNLEFLVREQVGIKEINNRAVRDLTDLISTKPEGAAVATPLKDLFLNKEAEGSGAELNQLFGISLPGQEVELSALFQIYTSVVEHTQGACLQAGLSYAPEWRAFIIEKRPNVMSFLAPEVAGKDPDEVGADKKSKKGVFRKMSRMFRDRKSSGSESSPASVRRNVKRPDSETEGALA